jgi:hypothetical protein
VQLGELDPGLWLAGLWRPGRFGLGLSTGLLARAVRVEAVAGGRRAEASALVWAVPVTLELQVALLERMALRIAPGVDVNLDPETFAIGGVPLVALGRLRPGLELSLVLTDR